MAHLSAWLVREGLDSEALSQEAVERFWVERRAAGFGDYVSPKALVPLLGYLRDLGVVPGAGPSAVTEVARRCSSATGPT